MRVINRQRDSLELLLRFGATFPNAVTHVVRKGYFGPPEKFFLYQESNLRKAIEAHGQLLDVRMKAANRAHRLQFRSEVQDRRLLKTCATSWSE